MCAFSHLEIGERVPLTFKGICHQCGGTVPAENIDAIYNGHNTDKIVFDSFTIAETLACPSCHILIGIYREACHEGGAIDFRQLANMGSFISSRGVKLPALRSSA